MGTKVIGLSSNLPFDEEQERDIIKYVEALKNSHKIGQFLATLIRAAFDSPELLEKKDGVLAEGAIAKQIQDLGMSYDRYQFMKSVSKEVSSMKSKVDEIYGMVLKTYELALIGKRLGLEEKAKNEVLANFILQKQIKDLQDVLGIQLTSSVFAANKAKELDEFAQEALEYIINSYDSVVTELKDIVTTQQVISQPAQVSKVETTDKVVQTINNEEDTEEILDYGMDFRNRADTKALGNFFGND